MLTVVMLQGCEKVLYDLPRHSDAVCQTDRQTEWRQLLHNVDCIFTRATLC